MIGEAIADGWHSMRTPPKNEQLVLIATNGGGARPWIAKYFAPGLTPSGVQNDWMFMTWENDNLLFRDTLGEIVWRPLPQCPFVGGWDENDT